MGSLQEDSSKVSQCVQMRCPVAVQPVRSAGNRPGKQVYCFNVGMSVAIKARQISCHLTAQTGPAGMRNVEQRVNTAWTLATLSELEII